jgi:hypothetical protein
MRILEAIQAINELERKGVIEKYAVGGAVAAGFYVEATATLDMDIFIPVHLGPDSLLVDLSPLYSYLRSQGYPMEGEYFFIADTPVQFLPPTSKLVEDAIESAVVRDIDGTPVRVFSLEHLAAIALETGRGKDKIRLQQFLDSSTFDVKRFQTLVKKFKLEDRWKQFQRQFLDETQ